MPILPVREGGSDDAALRRLGRLKLRAAIRKQLRRLSTARGIVFAVLGGLLFVFWLGSLVAWSGFSERGVVEAREVLPVLRVGAFVLFVTSLLGSLQHRGLFLPADEIERLFSAPVSRAAITRYRLRAMFGRMAFGGVLLGLMITRRVPVPLYGFLGAISGLAAIAVTGQLLSILSGALEKRLPLALVRWPVRLAFIVLLVGVLFVMMFFLQGSPGSPGERFLARLAQNLPGANVASWMEAPIVRWATLPFEPWVRAVSAESAIEFALWFPASLVLVAMLYELTARLPIDYRELSLATAANVAERLRRVRRVGGGASASGVTKRTRSIRVPFFFGRGPVGALAWRKSVEILRKARGTLWVSTVVLVVLLVLSGLIARDGDPQKVLAASVGLAVLGTIYLCSGLRFDFRDDLDRMATIRSWPLRPTAVFFATLVPEFVLVTLLLWIALAIRIVWSGGAELGVLSVFVAIPPSVFAWLALDNIVFLLAPVRFVPGQEGALQNAGRLVVLLFLRMIGVFAVALLAGGAGLGAWLAADALGASRPMVWAVALAVGWLVLAGTCVGLTLAGGWTYSRFDVARDRG